MQLNTRGHTVAVWGDMGAPGGGSMGPVIARYGHWVGFVCMGVPPASKMRALGVSGSTKLGGTPHTYKTNPVAIWS